MRTRIPDRLHRLRPGRRFFRAGTRPKRAARRLLGWAAVALGGLGAAVAPGVSGPTGAVAGQDVPPAAREEYFRAVAEHFKLPLQEVHIVAEWEIGLEEVPVVLFLARRAGVSPDAVVGVRREGVPWLAVARRFGLTVHALHLPLPEGEPLGPLKGLYEQFRSHPPAEWSGIEVNDAEAIGLVNLRVLSDAADVSPLQVLRAWERSGSFPVALSRLGG